MYYFFYIPIGTEARVRGTPWGTIAITAINVLVFLFFSLFPGFEIDYYRLALLPGAPSLLTSITSSFLHAGWFHLASNLLYLVLLGPPIESRIGTGRFLVAYLGFAGLANMAQAAWVLTAAPDLTSVPIVGSSGAIAGVMGLFLVRLYFVRLRIASILLFYLHGVARPTRFALPAVVAIGSWFVLQAVYQLVDSSGGTAYVSHLSGLLFGIGLGFLLGFGGEGRLERRLVLGDRYAQRGEWFAALGEYESYLARVPDDPEVLIQAARVHRVTDQSMRSVDRFRQAIAAWLKRGDLGAACDAFDEMKRLLGNVTIPASDLLRVARGFEQRGRPSDASRAYEAYGRNYPAAPGATTALLKAADIERKLLNNPGRAQFLLRELLHRPLTPEMERLARERLRATEEALAAQRAPGRAIA